MNCKPGDLAVIVRSEAGNEGRIVECLEFLGPVSPRICRGRALWKVRVFGPPLNWSGRAYGPLVADVCLRPIRDSDGTDETLIYAGKPQTVEA